MRRARCASRGCAWCHAYGSAKDDVRPHRLGARCDGTYLGTIAPQGSSCAPGMPMAPLRVRERMLASMTVPGTGDRTELPVFDLTPTTLVAAIAAAELAGLTLSIWLRVWLSR